MSSKPKLKNDRLNGSHLQVVDIPLVKLEPTSWNPRKISEKEKNDLKNSMVRFGCVTPLVVRQQDYSIIGGHQRYYVGLELGLDRLPCMVLSISESEAKVLNIALNKVNL